MQQGFFDWIDGGTGSAILEAVAGAGKTTTLIQALSRMSGSIYFGAYNKAAAEEIKAKAAKAGIDNPNLRMACTALASRLASPHVGQSHQGGQ